MPQKIKDIRTSDDQRVISWEAPDEVKYKRNSSWYLILIGAAIALGILFYFYQQWAGMVLVVAVVLVLLSQAKVKTRLIRYTLTKDGFNFLNKDYPFGKLKSFWIVATPNYPKLFIEKTGFLKTPITAYIDRISPDEVREFLKKYLPEGAAAKGNVHENIGQFLR